MVGFLRHARRSRFLRHNSVFFISAVAVGALNYLYYPIMGRLLNTAQFGEVQTLISLFLQIAIFLSVLGLVTIKPKFSAAVFMAAWFNMLVTYCLALRRFSLAWLFLASTASAYWLICSFHASLDAIVISLSIGSAVMICAISTRAQSDGTWRRAYEEF